MSDYLTDEFGMSFYKLCEPTFNSKLTIHKMVDRHNPLSGHSWTECVLKHNHEDILRKLKKAYQTWLQYPETINKLHPLNFMPRTIRETKMIQADIDGVIGWWNVK